jgi:hypothetical protein
MAEASALEEGDMARAAQIRDARTIQLLQAYTQQLQPQQPDPSQAQAQNQMFAMMTEQAVSQKFGDDWAGLRDEVSQIIGDNPYLVPETPDPLKAAEAVSFVAEAVRSRRLAEQVQEQANAQTLQRQQKMQAQGLLGSSGRVQSQASAADEWQAALKKLPGTGYGTGL